MKINVGSTNVIKIAGVKDTIALYPDIFPNPEVCGIDVVTDLYHHPKNLDETAQAP